MEELEGAEHQTQSHWRYLPRNKDGDHDIMFIRDETPIICTAAANGYWLHSVILRGGLGAVWDSWWLVRMGIIRTKRLGAENKRWVVYVFFWLPIRQSLYSLSESESVLAAPLPSHCSTGTAVTAPCHLSPAAGRLITLKSCLLQLLQAEWHAVTIF